MKLPERTVCFDWELTDWALPPLAFVALLWSPFSQERVVESKVRKGYSDFNVSCL